MSEDWEKELEEMEMEEKKGEKEEDKDGDKKKKSKVRRDFEDESEVIVKTKVVTQPQTIRQKDKPIDYEQKYQERRKDDIKFEKEIEESVKNILDPELRLKKKLELLELKRAKDFLGKEEKKEEVDLNITLKEEADYINLATKTTVKINNAEKGPKFTFEFIKKSIELLLPFLDEEKVDDFIKVVKIQNNQKNKEKGQKKEKKEKEIKVKKTDKFEERQALFKQYGDGTGEPNNKEDFNDDGDFM